MNKETFLYPYWPADGQLVELVDPHKKTKRYMVVDDYGEHKITKKAAKKWLKKMAHNAPLVVVK
jgi:hypothetical protein